MSARAKDASLLTGLVAMSAVLSVCGVSSNSTGQVTRQGYAPQLNMFAVGFTADGSFHQLVLHVRASFTRITTLPHRFI